MHGLISFHTTKHMGLINARQEDMHSIEHVYTHTMGWVHQGGFNERPPAIILFKLLFYSLHSFVP